MEIKLTSAMVDDQAKALAVYTGILGFVLKRDTPIGEHRFLTVISPKGHDDVERLLEPFGFPPARTFRRRWSTPEFPERARRRRRAQRNATGSRRARRDIPRAAGGDGTDHGCRLSRHLRQPYPDLPGVTQARPTSPCVARRGRCRSRWRRSPATTSSRIACAHSGKSVRPTPRRAIARRDRSRRRQSEVAQGGLSSEIVSPNGAGLLCSPTA